ncbi:nucleotide-binding alpha-beta plait domain, zinc finger, RING/FYVE/PHD-type containing protein [Tanacetum coccineum]
MQTEGRCPACRAPYDKDRIVGLESNFQRVAANSSSHKQKQPKQKTNEGRKDLSSVRVIQRKMAYIIGLPLSLADEDLLASKFPFSNQGPNVGPATQATTTEDSSIIGQ